ncbi:hypothetical protein ACTFIR_009741 [Dictyostelium discoideum]
MLITKNNKKKSKKISKRGTNKYFLQKLLSVEKLTNLLKNKQRKIVLARKAQKKIYHKGKFKITDITSIPLRGEVIKRIIKPKLKGIDFVVDEMDHNPINDIEILFYTREQEEERRREEPEEYPLDAWDKDVLGIVSAYEPQYKNSTDFIYHWEFGILHPVASFEEFFEIDFNHVARHKVDSYGDFAFYGNDPYVKTFEYPTEQYYISDEEAGQFELDYLLHYSTKIEKQAQYLLKRKEHYNPKQPQILETDSRSEHYLMNYFYYNKLENILEKKEGIDDAEIYKYIKLDFSEKMELKLEKFYDLNRERRFRIKKLSQSKLYEFEKAALKGIGFDCFMLIVGIIIFLVSTPYLFSQLPWRVKYTLHNTWYHNILEVRDVLFSIPKIRNLEWLYLQAIWEGELTLLKTRGGISVLTALETILFVFYKEKDPSQTMNYLANFIFDIY